MCCFSCKAQKITTSRVFNLISDSLENRRWWPRWRPLLVTSQASSSKKIKGFPPKVKSFRNTAKNQKPRGGVPSPPPPTIPCTTVEV